MCIAILVTPGKWITDKVFTRCFKSNPHGCGFAYIDPTTKKVKIEKGFFSLGPALEKYHKLVDTFGGTDYPMLIHFRAATVGQQGYDNCHPFAVKNGAMIHNGTFFRDNSALKSDSRQVAEIMYNELTYETLTEHKEHFKEAFGYNRVAFLFDEGKYVIISENYHEGKNMGRLGQWCDGIWYSNGGYAGDYGGYYGDNENLRKTNGISDAHDELALAELDKLVWSSKR